MKKSVRSILDYLVLTVIISVAIILILFFNGNKPTQQAIIVGLSVLYVIWGTVHHLKEKTFRTQIFFEYFLFALLGAILVLGLLR